MPNRRGVTWFDNSSVAQALPSGSQNNHDLSVNMTASDKRGCTVTRILLTLAMRPTLLDLENFLFYGIVMVSEDAAIAAAYPDPDISTDEPGWMLRDFRSIMTHDLNDPASIVTVTYDLRAQRKFTGASNSLRFLITNVAGGGTAASYSLLSRVLCRMA